VPNWRKLAPMQNRTSGPYFKIGTRCPILRSLFDMHYRTFSPMFGLAATCKILVSVMEWGMASRFLVVLISDGGRSL
jgi:hypothetical protein